MVIIAFLIITLAPLVISKILPDFALIVLPLKFNVIDLSIRMLFSVEPLTTRLFMSTVEPVSVSLIAFDTFVYFHKPISFTVKVMFGMLIVPNILVSSYSRVILYVPGSYDASNA